MRYVILTVITFDYLTANIDQLLGEYELWPLLLTWFNFNPSMDK